MTANAIYADVEYNYFSGFPNSSLNAFLWLASKIYFGRLPYWGVKFEVILRFNFHSIFILYLSILLTPDKYMIMYFPFVGG